MRKSKVTIELKFYYSNLKNAVETAKIAVNRRHCRRLMSGKFEARPPPPRKFKKGGPRMLELRNVLIRNFMKKFEKETSTPSQSPTFSGKIFAFRKNVFEGGGAQKCF
jgi:hypothetical protein